MNRQHKRKVSKEMYKSLSHLNDTIAVFYIGENFEGAEHLADMGFGLLYQVDRKSMKLKSEEVEVSTLDYFNDFMNETLEFCQIASNYKSINFCGLSVRATVDTKEEVMDFDMQIHSLSDKEISSLINDNWAELHKDIENLMILKINELHGG